MNDPNFLAPPSSSSTKTTMNTSPGSDTSVSSGQNSPDSSRSRSPLASFDIPLDPSDPLSFLMDPHSGESSTEESYMATNTPPSSHNSPSGDWSVKDATMDWPESQFTYPFHGSDPSVNALNPGEFDASFFVEETLALWMNPNNIPQAPDLSSFGFTFDTNAFNDLQVPESTYSSGASSIASASSSPTMARAQVSQHSAQLPSVAAVQPTQSVQSMVMPKGEPQMSGNQLLDELTRVAKQTAGVSVALPIGMETSNASNGQGGESYLVCRTTHNNNELPLQPNSLFHVYSALHPFHQLHLQQTAVDPMLLRHQTFHRKLNPMCLIRLPRLLLRDARRPLTLPSSDAIELISMLVFKAFALLSLHCAFSR